MANRTFDDVVSPFDPVMIVVTTASGNERAGCLVGFHSQCSIEPPRYAVWLSKANHTFRVALLAEHLAFHVLGEDDLDLAELFGTLTGDEVDKFTRCEWTEGPGGVPLLTRLERRIIGRKHALFDDGSDHVCVTLDPIDAHAPANDSAFRALRLHAVTHLNPGHEAQERQRP